MVTPARRLAKKLRRKEHFKKVLEIKRSNPLRYFEKLLGGMNAQDLSFVLNLSTLASSVRMYDGERKELIPVADLVPWPVQFCLVRYHHKHAFENRGPPSLKSFMSCLDNFGNKLKWRADNFSWSKHSMHGVPAFKGTVTAGLKRLIMDFRKKMLDTFHKVRRRHTTGNMNAALRWTIRWLRDRSLCVAPFDKESGVCLIKLSDLSQVQRDVLASSFYCKISADAVNEVEAKFKKQYISLAKAVQTLEQSDRTGHAIRRSLFCKEAWYSARLLVTCNHISDLRSQGGMSMLPVLPPLTGFRHGLLNNSVPSSSRGF